MKFTVLAVSTQQESESDYETAVDMSHSTIHERFVQLRADGGAAVLLREQTISTHYSSLEPDLDQFEQTGDAVYVNVGSDRQAKQSHSSNGFLLVVPRLPILSAEDWGTYQLLKDDEGWNRIETMPDAQKQRLSDFHDFPELLGENVLARPLPAEVITTLIAQLSDQPAEGQVLDVALSSASETLLLEAGRKALEQKASNNQAYFENQISENTWKAQQAIADTVKEARAEIGRRFKP